MEGSTRRPDIRRPLPVLQAEWEGCRACDLGLRREEVQGALVFGEGTNGVMFIGEGPGKDEEKEGRPFVGQSGRFLRRTLEVVRIKDYYLTNTVCCRSWSYEYDTEGNLKLDFKTREPRRKDSSPNTAQVRACSARLLEQIYLVDPILIVTLGNSAAEALLHASVNLQKDSGVLRTVSVPGASFRPSLTPGGKWGRKVGPKENRVLVWPYEQNVVTYPLLPLYHPAFAMSHEQDKRPGSPMHLFATGMLKAGEIYARFMQEISGDRVLDSDLTEDDVYEAHYVDQHND